MKNKTVFFIVSLILFLYLFYDQYPGLNLLIFTIYLVAALVLFLKVKLTTFSIIAIISVLICAGSVAWYGDEFSIFYTIVLLIFLPVFVLDQEKHAVLSPFKFAQGFFNAIFIKPFEKQATKQNGTNSKKRSLQIALYALIIFVVFLIFLALYTYVNDAFANAVSAIDLPKIDAVFLFLVIIGTLYFLLWNNYKTSAFSQWLPINKKTVTAQTNTLETNSIRFGVTATLIVLLSCLLMVLLGFDLAQLFSKTIPTNETYSSYVHQGVQSVILSIGIVIAILFILFNKPTGTSKQQKTLQTLAAVWLALNVLLLITTFLKNQTYINHYGLTLKRLGVYGFLLITFCAVVVAAITIQKQKTTYFFIDRMLYTVALFLVCICPINWSNTITNYNLKHFTTSQVDIHYLLSLSNYNIITLNQYNQSHILSSDIQQQISTKNKQVHERANVNWRSKNLFFNYADKQIK